MRGLGECPGRWNAAAHSPDQACACPRHALQKSPTINPVVVEVLQFLIDKIFFLVRHLASGVFVAFTVDNWTGSVLFPAKMKGCSETSTVAWTALPISPAGRLTAEYNGGDAHGRGWPPIKGT